MTVVGGGEIGGGRGANERVASALVAAVEAELKMLGAHMAFPFVFVGKGGCATVTGEGTDEPSFLGVLLFDLG